jgi:hypothetical protein
MRLILPRQVKKACERPLHAQWARPAGLAFLQIPYGSVWYVSIFTDDRNGNPWEF